jgi:hypothetical protein
MPDALLIVAALAAQAVGFAWLAMAMDAHWQQVSGDPVVGRVRAMWLRLAGAMALVASFAACLVVDHASMASLVWVMGLAAAALLVAMTLAFTPQLLLPLTGRWYASRHRR